MARSLCNAKVISSLAENVFLAIIRRGFAASATQAGVAVTRGSKENMMKQTAAAKVEATKEESWVPDPVTGYYRPENHRDEIDVAELRDVLLNNKKK